MQANQCRCDPGIILDEGLRQRLALGLAPGVDDALVERRVTNPVRGDRRVVRRRRALAVDQVLADGGLVGGAVELKAVAGTVVLERAHAQVRRFDAAHRRPRQMPGNRQALILCLRIGSDCGGLTGLEHLAEVRAHALEGPHPGHGVGSGVDAAQNWPRGGQDFRRVHLAGGAVDIELARRNDEIGGARHFPHTRDPVGNQQGPDGGSLIREAHRVRMHVVVAGHHVPARSINRLCSSYDADIARCDLLDLSAVEDDVHPIGERAVERVHDGRVLNHRALADFERPVAAARDQNDGRASDDGPAGDQWKSSHVVAFQSYGRARAVKRRQRACLVRCSHCLGRPATAPGVNARPSPPIRVGQLLDDLSTAPSRPANWTRRSAAPPRPARWYVPAGRNCWLPGGGRWRAFAVLPNCDGSASEPG